MKLTVMQLPREELYERINQRVDRMMEQGLLEEVKSLLPYKHLNALQTVGYRELFEHMDGQYSLEDAVAKIKQHTRHYAKRQITWWANAN
jgi:tRNA dimethylallyltransferase